MSTDTTEPTPEECAKMLELAEKASNGPWKSKPNHKPYKIVEIDKAEMYTTMDMKPEDSDFIAFARTFAPKAARALAAKSAEVNAMRASRDAEVAAHKLTVSDTNAQLSALKQRAEQAEAALTEAPNKDRMAELIAVALLTPCGYHECNRLQIMERTGPLPSDERNMGGHNKQSIIRTILATLEGMEASQRLSHRRS